MSNRSGHEGAHVDELGPRYMSCTDRRHRSCGYTFGSVPGCTSAVWPTWASDSDPTLCAAYFAASTVSLRVSGVELWAELVSGTFGALALRGPGS